MGDSLMGMRLEDLLEACALPALARPERREIDLAHPGGMLEPRFGERLQLAGLNLDEVGNAAGGSQLLRASGACLQQPLREVRQFGAERLREPQTLLR